MKTFNAKKNEVKKNWLIVDAKDKRLGRLASEVAFRLRGKHKPEYTPNTDTGDYIVIINAEKVKVSGNKFTDKMYYRYTGYVGNLKSISFKDLQAKQPEKIISKAVVGMLPKGPLGRSMARKMKIYKGEEHLNHAQKPKVLDI
jgi:large subunit ribosomal protein L13